VLLLCDISLYSSHKQICRKCLQIKLNGFRLVQTPMDITSNTFYRCTATLRTHCRRMMEEVNSCVLTLFSKSHNWGWVFQAAWNKNSLFLKGLKGELIIVSWDVGPRSLVEIHQPFWWTCCYRLQGMVVASSSKSNWISTTICGNTSHEMVMYTVTTMRTSHLAKGIFSKK
jgi:hypothetical protein